MNIAIALIPSVVLFGIAGYLAIKGMDNWGWFLFIGLLALGAMTEVVKIG